MKKFGTHGEKFGVPHNDDGTLKPLKDVATRLVRGWHVKFEGSKTTTDGNNELAYTNADQEFVISEIVGDETKPTVSFKPGATFSDLPHSSELNVDTTEVLGFLNSTEIHEQDIANKVYDGAVVILFLIDMETKIAITLLKGTIGEIQRVGTRKNDEGVFRCELRGETHKLQQPTGRLFQTTCSHGFGDWNPLSDHAMHDQNRPVKEIGCRLDTTPYRTHWQVFKMTDNTKTVFTASVEDAGETARNYPNPGNRPSWPNNFFTNGLLEWDHENNPNSKNRGKVQIKKHTFKGGEHIFELWEPTPYPITLNDVFWITPGCDKTYKTCGLWGQREWFGGFPFMPGAQTVFRVADRSKNFDYNGEPLVSVRDAENADDY